MHKHKRNYWLKKEEKIQLWIISYLTFEHYLLHICNSNFSLHIAASEKSFIHKNSLPDTLFHLAPL